MELVSPQYEFYVRNMGNTLFEIFLQILVLFPLRRTIDSTPFEQTTITNHFTSLKIVLSIKTYKKIHSTLSESVLRVKKSNVTVLK